MARWNHTRQLRRHLLPRFVGRGIRAKGVHRQGAGGGARPGGVGLREAQDDRAGCRGPLGVRVHRVPHLGRERWRRRRRRRRRAGGDCARFDDAREGWRHSCARGRHGDGARGRDVGEKLRARERPGLVRVQRGVDDGARGVLRQQRRRELRGGGEGGAGSERL